jgi:hypothetical protein
VGADVIALLSELESDDFMHAGIPGASSDHGNVNSSSSRKVELLSFES